MNDSVIDRRKFISNLLCLGGIAILASPQRSLAWASERAGLNRPGLPLTQLIRQQDSARVIGQAYLEAVPEEGNALLLSDTILGSLSLDADHAAALAPETLHQRLRERVREDFRDSRTVKLDGWILSRTEARLMALIALS
ncbi:MAG: hypothetical protein KDH97_11820 [Calditrichaeota bacterium]|nr:hypothetical protein [Calditrichota bacterium]MCB0290933.1 hypothetical protein [Calditrichota bacterium]MCB0303383.1 hypothetical protein [Calditrichota bacterium]MCB0314212.1 hypothetical protein [Calditrichota bacterium]